MPVTVPSVPASENIIQIPIDNGMQNVFEIQLQNEDGAYLDLAGYTLSINIRENKDQSILLTLSEGAEITVLSESEGLFSVEIDATNSALLPSREIDTLYNSEDCFFPTCFGEVLGTMEGIPYLLIRCEFDNRATGKQG